MRNAIVGLGTACILLAGLPAAHAQMTKATDGPFQSVPLADRAYRDVDTLYHAGTLMGGTGDFFLSTGGHAMRYNFIVITASLLSLAGLVPEGTLARRADYLTPDAEVNLIHNPQAMAALMELSREFRYDLEKYFRIDVASAQSRLAALRLAALSGAAPPKIGQTFPDVPSRHWAVGAVETLRLAGVIVGYPSGVFDAKGMASVRRPGALRQITVLVNGTPLDFSHAPPSLKPTLDRGVVMVPIRPVLESLGARVDFDDHSLQTEAYVTYKGRRVALAAEFEKAMANTRPNPGQSPPPGIYITSGRSPGSAADAKVYRFIMPLDFLADILGFTLTWDEQNRVAEINTQP